MYTPVNFIFKSYGTVPKYNGTGRLGMATYGQVLPKMNERVLLVAD